MSATPTPAPAGKFSSISSRSRASPASFACRAESYLAALDALYDSGVEVTICRQEAGATIMAVTEGRLTGRPGVCFVTRGPGATNAAHGVHIAEHDSAPLILFIGQVERAMLGRGAFQEMDYRAVFGSFAKWVDRDQRSRAIPEILQRAWHVAMQGRPGPVVISLARGRADRTRRGRRRAARRSRADLAGPDPDGRIAEDAVGGRAPDRDRRRSRLDAGGDRRRACASPSASTCRSSPSSGAPARSTASTTITPARSASPPIRSSSSASRTPISCC